MSWIFTAYSFDKEDEGLDPLHGLGEPVIGISGRVREMWEIKVDTQKEFVQAFKFVHEQGWHLPGFPFSTEEEHINGLVTYENYQDNEIDLQDNEGSYIDYGISIEGAPDHEFPTVDEQIEWLKSLPRR